MEHESFFVKRADPELEGYSYGSGFLYDFFGITPEAAVDEAQNDTSSWFSWLVEAPIETGADIAVREQAAVHDAAVTMWDAWFGDMYASEVHLEWGAPVANGMHEYSGDAAGIAYMRYPELGMGDTFGYDQGGFDATGFADNGAE